MRPSIRVSYLMFKNSFVGSSPPPPRLGEDESVPAGAPADTQSLAMASLVAAAVSLFLLAVILIFAVLNFRLAGGDNTAGGA